MDLGSGCLRFSRNGIPLGDAFSGVTGPLVAVVTQASEESKVTIQNRPTVLNMGEYTGELRCAGHRAHACMQYTRTSTHARCAHGCLECASLAAFCVAAGHVLLLLLLPTLREYADAFAVGTRCVPGAICTSLMA